MSVVVSSVATGRKLVALTFDDGPDPASTPPLLEVLDGASAPASFFVRGEALDAAAGSLVARMLAAGHDVGNHTHRHRDLEGADAATIREEIGRTHALLLDETGRAPTLLRPPYGRGAVEVNAVATEMGYRATVLWSVLAADWESPQPPAGVIVERVLAGYDEGAGLAPGAIVLLHDGCSPRRAGESRRETVEATRALVPALRARGFRLVTVSELLDAGGL